jgi:hypothetical protein
VCVRERERERESEIAKAREERGFGSQGGGIVTTAGRATE